MSTTPAGPITHVYTYTCCVAAASRSVAKNWMEEVSNPGLPWEVWTDSNIGSASRCKVTLRLADFGYLLLPCLVRNTQVIVHVFTILFVTAKSKPIENQIIHNRNLKLMPPPSQVRCTYLCTYLPFFLSLQKSTPTEKQSISNLLAVYC